MPLLPLIGEVGDSVGPRPLLTGTHTYPRQIPSDQYWDLRLHTTQAKTFINALISRPGSYQQYFPDVRVFCVVTLPDSQVALMAEVGQLAETLGIPISFGQQAGPTSNAIGGLNWVSPDHWRTKARHLELIEATVGQYTTVNYWQIDYENYVSGGPGAGEPELSVLAALGSSVTEFAEAKRPWLDAMARFGRVPYMYPIDDRNEGSKLIVAACGGLGVLSFEGGTFNSERYQRRNSDEYLDFVGLNAGTHHRMLANHPGAVLAPANFDDVLRSYGWKYRNLNELGREGWTDMLPRRGWIYLRTSTDLASAGLASWFKGTTLDSTNDPIIAQQIAPNTVSIEAAMTMGSYGNTVNAPRFQPWRLPANAVDNGHPVHAEGFQVTGTTDCRFWQLSTSDSLPAATDFTLRLPHFKIPSDVSALGAWSVICGVGRIWQLGYNKTDDRIELRTLATVGSHTFIITNTPARAAELVYCISYQHSTKTWRVNGTANTTTNAWTGSTAVLRFGAGFDLATASVVEGFDGLIWTHGCDWQLNLSYASGAEETRLLDPDDIYPRGIV